jgi:hypothetical protein
MLFVLFTHRSSVEELVNYGNYTGSPSNRIRPNILMEKVSSGTVLCLIFESAADGEGEYSKVM